MNKTGISWTDLTWNPMSGCVKIAPECKYCYAETLAENKRGVATSPGVVPFPKGFDLTIREHKLREPARVREPSLIFMNSMSDLGLEGLPLDYFDRIIDVAEQVDRHRYQTLTKRAEILLERFRRRGRPVPPSMWIGGTCGHPSRVGTLDTLRRFRDLGARVLFISAEPLLGRLMPAGFRLDGIDWLITGGESGNHIGKPGDGQTRGLVHRTSTGRWEPRADKMDYVRELRDEADRAGCAHWFKQWGGPRPNSAGRILDGRTHDGMPTHIAGAMPPGYVHEPPGAVAEKRQLTLLV